MKAKKMVGVGIIGCGGRVRDMMNKMEGIGVKVNICALMDPRAKNLQYYKKKFGSNAKTYTDHKDLLKNPEVQWVIIGSPNHLHRDHVIDSFKAGKNVFSEKPLAVNVKECHDIYKAYKKYNKKFATGFVLRFAPLYKRIKSILEKGDIGKIISLEFNETLAFNHGGFIMSDPWRRHTEYSGGHLLEKCCHDFDLINWMVDSLAIKVASFGGLDFFTSKNKHRIKEVGKNRKGEKAYLTWPNDMNPGDADPFSDDKDVVDNQIAIIEYANGVRATFHTNMNAAIPERRMYILGGKGALRADLVTGKIEVKKIGHYTQIKTYNIGNLGGHGGADHAIVRSLVDNMVNGSDPICGGEEGLRSAITCLAADDARLKNKVIDMRPYWKKVGVSM